MTYSASQLAEYHSKSRNHWDLLRKSTYCACFRCCEFFFSDKIRAFTDANNTALCPICEIDAVIPYVLGENEFTNSLIKTMNAHYYGDMPTDPLLEGKE